jgi:hypothetical protein
MVLLLPKVKSFGEEFGEKFGSGAVEGYQAAAEKKKQLAALSKLKIDPAVLDLPKEGRAEYFKNQFISKTEDDGKKAKRELDEEKLKALRGNQSLFTSLGLDLQGNSQAENQVRNQAENQNEIQQNPFDGKQGQNIQETEQKNGTPEQNISNVSDDLLKKVASFKGQPGQEGILGNMAQTEIDRRADERKVRTDKEKQYFKFNEPKLQELSDVQRKLEMEEMRYDRLGELFSHDDKFPSTALVALFSKDGQINDLAYSQLPAEAQEAIKLIIDSTSNIKDTYGARVTNFDLQTYLKKLPSLLNSPEGKRRVLRDLKIINQLNQMHSKGIQEIFEQNGGSDKLPFSKVESIYKKRYGEQERALKDQFVNPDKGIFEEKPDAHKFLGKRLKDPNTGEIFISDGKEWKPFNSNQDSME